MKADVRVAPLSLFGQHAELAAGAHLTALTKLSLYGLRQDFMDDVGMRRLTTSPLFAHLRRVELSSNRLGERRFPPSFDDGSFLEGLSLPRLEGLSLSGWNVFPRGGLARARLPALRQLELHTFIPAQGVAELLEELSHDQVAPALEFITIKDTSSSRVRAALLALGAYTPPSLRALAVEGRAETAIAIAAAPFVSQLTRIELHGSTDSQLNAHTLVALARAPLPSLRVLVLGPPLSLDAARALAQAPWLGALTRLVLSQRRYNLSINYTSLEPLPWADTLLALRASPAFRALEGAGRVQVESNRRRLREEHGHL